MRLRYGRMLSDKLDGEHGLSRTRLAELAQQFPAVRAELARRRAAGEFGYLDLPGHDEALEGVRRFAEGVGQAYDHVLVVGPGGAALGVQALAGALRPAGWNELSDDQRDHYPRLTVIDHADPAGVSGAIGRIDPRRVLVHLIAPDADSPETLALYLVLRGWLDRALGRDAAARHLVLTAEAGPGPFAKLARQEGIGVLETPPRIGSRYRALTAAGLLPAALVGIDVERVLAGARQATEALERPELLQNPPALFAGLLWAADAWLGARVHVLAPTDDRLRAFSRWFVHVWAESLGKRVDRRGGPAWIGPTPVAAAPGLGQEGLGQLLMEGPFDKVVAFLRTEDPGSDPVIPATRGLPADAAWLPGRTLGDVARASWEANSAALSRLGRMNLTLLAPAMDPESVGELIMFIQAATGVAGIWYGINPFDQPSADRGAHLAAAELGRPGFTRASPVVAGNGHPADISG